MNELNNVDIENKEELISIIDDKELYNGIYITNLDLDIYEINTLLNKCKVITFLDCTITNTSNIFLITGSNNIQFINATFNMNVFYIKTKRHTLGSLSFLNCNFKKTNIIISNSNFEDINIHNCKSISKITIHKSLFNTFDIMNAHIDCINMTSVNVFNLSIVIIKTKLSFNSCSVANAHIDSYCSIKSIKSSSILTGGLMGKELKFDIYGYKKVNDEHGNSVILYLKIPKGSKIRHSDVSKCRSDKVITLKIIDLEGNIINNNCKYYPILYNNDTDFYYQLNKVTFADSFDESIRECSNGIHFFMNIEDAINF